METLSDKCTKASEYLNKKRSELLELEEEYKGVVKAQGSPLDLLDIKEKLISFSIGMSPIYSRLKELYLQAQQERDNAFTLAFIKERGTINEKTNKPQSLESCERNAKLKIANEYMVEYQSDINYTIVRKIISDTQLLIDASIQRVSVVKGEIFNSRQPNTI